jgi:5-methylcytosine-specific restriction endonuclease McrA
VTFQGTNFKWDRPSRVEAKKAQQLEDEANERTVYRQVDIRDRRRCRACGRKSNAQAMGLLERAHHHHIVYRSAGGPTDTWNIALICALCHDAEHVKRTLKIEGNADTGLMFWKRDEDDVWFIWRREISVGHFEKD